VRWIVALIAAAVFASAGVAVAQLKDEKVQASVLKPPPPPTPGFAVGVRVAVGASPASVRSSPGGLQIGAQEAGAVGVITAGPTPARIEGSANTNTFQFWRVDFPADPDGWVEQSALGLAPAPQSSVPPPAVIRLCALRVAGMPPDGSGGWKMQVRLGNANAGTGDTSVPYQRDVMPPDGPWTIALRWTKTGGPTVTTASVKGNCP
jgi:hypothetical protein